MSENERGTVRCASEAVRCISRTTTGTRALAAGGRLGLTLVELIVVLFVLVALAGLLVPTFNNAGRDASRTATRATLATVARVIVGPGGYVEAMRFARDSDDFLGPFGDASGLPWPGQLDIDGGSADHPQLHFLFRQPSGLPVPPYDPVTRIGWNGPWLDASAATTYGRTGLDASFTATYGAAGDIAPIDGWGNPVVIQLPVGGRDFARLVSAGPNNTIDTDPDANTPVDVDDDVVLYLYRENP